MDTYGLLLFLHVLGAAFWAGGAVMFYILAERMHASNDMSVVQRLFRESERLGQRFFMPIAVVVLISGILLVLDGEWGWDHWFILGGIVGIVATTVVGAVFLTKAENEYVAAIGEGARSDGTVEATRARMRMWAQVDIALLVVIIFLMTAKPGS